MAFHHERPKYNFFKLNMKQKIALTSIVKRVADLYSYLTLKSNEKMALIYGDPGLGKTASCQYLEETSSVIYCSILPAWTPSQLVNSLLYKACGERRRGLTGAISALLNHLEESQQGLIFDEAERLINRHNLLDTVRVIHDNSTVPILLVGMENIDNKLKQKRHFYDRCSGFVHVQKPNLADMRLAVKTYTNLHFSDEFLLEIMGDSDVGNNYRRVRQSIEYIASSLQDQSLLVVNSSHWNKPFIPDFARHPAVSSNVVSGNFS